MHTEPRTANIDRIYVHTNEGPEGNNSALGLSRYLRQIDGGYHVIVDDLDTIRCADDSQVVWGAGGDNSHSLHICLIGYASQSAAQWGDEYSTAEVERAAQQVAVWCAQYGVPTSHVTGASGQAPTGRGVCGHGDNHAAASEGHTDPGAGFPWIKFVERVKRIITPQPSAKAKAWRDRVSANPLRAEDSSNDVAILKLMLAFKGHNVGNLEPLYGEKLVAAVASFKHERGLPNLDGTVFGKDAAYALVK